MTINEWSREFGISLKEGTNPLEDVLFVVYIEEQQILDVAAGALTFESRSKCKVVEVVFVQGSLSETASELPRLCFPFSQASSSHPSLCSTDST